MIHDLDFLEALQLTLGFEGGTNHDPIDRGGLTKWGMSEKQFPQVKNPTFSKENAIQLYHEHYWDKLMCDQFPAPLRLILFDTAVNCGQFSAANWLQLTCCHAGKDIKIDGIVGKKQTVPIVNSLDQYLVAHGMLGFRMGRYLDLINSHPKQIKYIKGWARRCMRLQFVTVQYPELSQKLSC